MNKRGSHVGAVLSFIIFVTFLVFLYSIMEPAIKTKKDIQFFLDRLKIELVKEFSENMTSYTVKINDDFTIDTNKACNRLDNLLDGISIGDNLLIQEPDGTYLDYAVESQQTHLYVDIINPDYKFLKVYDSEGFASEQVIHVGCQNIPKDDYTMGLTSEGEHIFRERVNETAEIIKNSVDYADLKSRINIPDERNFGFSLMNGDKEIILETEEGEISANVYIEEFPITYMDEHAVELPGFLRIKIW